MFYIKKIVFLNINGIKYSFLKPLLWSVTKIHKVSSCTGFHLLLFSSFFNFCLRVWLFCSLHMMPHCEAVMGRMHRAFLSERVLNHHSNKTKKLWKREERNTREKMQYK